MTKEKSTLSRRSFLSSAAIAGTSGVIGAGGLLAACSGEGAENKLTPLRLPGEYYIPELPDKAIDRKPLKAALIGCGSRGTGAAFNFLDAANNVTIVACADVLREKLDNCRKRLKEQRNVEIADDMCFLGFDGYKKACELPDVDLVLIASPSLFHPEQLKYAIDQGKHAFCEKAACVDAAGYRTYMMAVKQAQTKGLCIVPGTHCHYHRGYVESYKMIQEGFIGRIVSANVYFNQGHLNPVRRRPEWTDMEFMLRDIFHWKWLTGDHVLDQGIHRVDAFTWFSHLKPVKAIGMGARLRRTGGDIYDTYSVDIEYEKGVHLHAMMRQIDNCDHYVADIIHGTNGSWKSVNEGNEITFHDVEGNVVWRYDNETTGQFEQHNPYVLEHVDLVNHIRSGKVINNAETTAISSLTCIMARESAYTGKACTWDEMTMSDLNFMPSELTMGNVDMSKYTVPVPGTSPKE